MPQTVAFIVFRGFLANSTLKKRLFLQQNLNLHQVCSSFMKTPERNNCRPLYTTTILNEQTSTLPMPLRTRKKAKHSEDKRSKHFVDSITVIVKGGDGGDGMISTLSIFRNEFAGPDGGE